MHDLVQIYAYNPSLVNVTVEPQWIIDCGALFMIGTDAIKTFGADIYLLEVGPAPFLPEQYLEFFLGGIDDMAVWSSFMWNRMLSWVMQPPTPPLPPMKEDLGKSRLSPVLSKLIQAIKVLYKSNQAVRDFVAQEFTPDNRGMYLALVRALISICTRANSYFAEPLFIRKLRRGPASYLRGSA